MEEQPIANHLCEVYSTALVINHLCSIMYNLLNGKFLVFILVILHQFKYTAIMAIVKNSSFIKK